MSSGFRILSSVLCTVATVLLAISIAMMGQTAFADEPIEVIVPPTPCSGCTTVCKKADDGLTCPGGTTQSCTGTSNCTSCACQTPPRGGCKCCKTGSACGS